MKRRHRVTPDLVLAVATISACGQEQRKAVANPVQNEAARQSMIDSRHDKAIVAKRGWTQAILGFTQDERAVTAPDAASPTSRRGKALDMFQLGMTVEEVRARARQSGLHSTSLFSWLGVSEEAWCAPASSHIGVGNVLAPKQLNFTGPASADAVPTYSLELIPVHGRLRVGSIQRVRDKVVRVGPDIERDARNDGDIAPYAPCELTTREHRSLARWDRIEELALRETLGAPALDRASLPSGVRAALDRWERSMIVECDGADDCYARHASFDGYWQSGGKFVVSYTLAVDGYSPHLVAYLVVLTPDCRLLWAGRPAVFAAHGMAGKRETADQADPGF